MNALPRGRGRRTYVAAGMLLLASTVGFAGDDPFEGDTRYTRPAPDIRDPGPDFGGFPNSPDVVPPGRFYLETEAAFTSTDNLRGSDIFRDILRPPDIALPTLLRVGLVQDWELRLFGSLINHQDESNFRATTSGPYGVGIKYHVAAGRGRPHRPAFGIEFQAALPIGSSDATAGHVLTSGSLNFEHELPRKFTVPWNIGYCTIVDTNGDSFVQADLQWSLVNDVTPRVQLYLTGTVNFPASNSAGGTASTLGIGTLWWKADRIALQALVGKGLNDSSADAIGQLIATFAF